MCYAQKKKKINIQHAFNNLYDWNANIITYFSAHVFITNWQRGKLTLTKTNCNLDAQF